MYKIIFTLLAISVITAEMNEKEKQEIVERTLANFDHAVETLDDTLPLSVAKGVMFNMFTGSDIKMVGEVDLDSEEYDEYAKGLFVFKKYMVEFMDERFEDKVTKEQLRETIATNSMVDYLEKKITEMQEENEKTNEETTEEASAQGDL